MDNIKSCINKMVEINREIEKLKAQYNELEAKVLAQFGEDTKDTKHKAATYAAETGNISACNADSVKVVYPTMLKQIFGAVYPDVVEEKITYTLTAAAKKLLAAIYKGEYIMGKTFEQAVSELPCSEDERKALSRKLKGKKYDSDRAALVSIGHFDEDSAADYAYMLSEVANWCEFWNMLNLSGKTSPEDIRETIGYINSAVAVETSPKISLKVID